MTARHNPAADTILSGITVLGIGASLLTAAATHSIEVGITACALVVLSIAGTAWFFDQQAVKVAKNPVTHFAKGETPPKQPADYPGPSLSS